MLAFLLGILAGFMAFQATAPLHRQGDLSNSVLVHLEGSMYLHVHHWMYCLALASPLSLLHRSLLGLCVGGVLHGLAFRDRFKVIRRLDDPPKGPFVLKRRDNKDISHV